MSADWTDGYIADINYTNSFHTELLPNSLLFCLTLKGLEAPDPSQPLRYCELGCGHGLTASMIALAHPDSVVDAVDFNPSQIAGARALAAAASLQNINFYERSFHDFLDEPGLPEYDIISLHGIYSWISQANRETILRFINKRLRPGGIVYISYNCAVGWAPLAPLRKLIQERAARASGTREDQVRAALHLLSEVLSVNANYFSFVPGAGTHAEHLKKNEINYIVHEYLGQEWSPSYFSDLAKELSTVKLSFAGSASFIEHVGTVTLSDEQRAVLDKVSDIAERENLRDFMAGQFFRRDIFVRGPLKLSAGRRGELLSGFRFALLINPKDFISNLTWNNRTIELPLETYGPVLKRMQLGPVRLEDLLADPACVGIGALGLLHILVVLMGSGQATLCLPEPGYALRHARATAFNRALYERTNVNSTVYFASPLLGGGVQCNWLSATFMGALERGIDPVKLAWRRLLDSNQRMAHQDRMLSTEAENVEELSRRLQGFMDVDLPRLKALGVSTLPG